MSRVKRIKLYLDSSILGFALNYRVPDRQAEANLLLRQIRAGKFIGGYSFATDTEINAARADIARKLRKKVEMARLHRVRLQSRSRAYDLAEKYCRARAIPREYFEDALHVAV